MPIVTRGAHDSMSICCQIRLETLTTAIQQHPVLYLVILMPTTCRSLAWPVNALDTLLRQCYTSPACQKLALRRSFLTKGTDPSVKDVAILGGGITGLATAHYLSRQYPEASITLLESSDRLGGWLRSEQVDVGDGKVYFEQGPRTLRPNAPNGTVTLDLVRSVGLLGFECSCFFADTGTWNRKRSNHDI